MGNAIISKGTVIQVGTGLDDIKAVVIEDFEIGVGEATVIKKNASDGTSYSFAGTQEDNELEVQVIMTDDTLKPITASVYGAGVVVSNETTYELRNAGGTINDIFLQTPSTTGSVAVKYQGVNGKGLVFVPQFKISNGWEGRLKYAVDYWKQIVQE